MAAELQTEDLQHRMTLENLVTIILSLHAAASSSSSCRPPGNPALLLHGRPELLLPTTTALNFLSTTPTLADATAAAYDAKVHDAAQQNATSDAISMETNFLAPFQLIFKIIYFGREIQICVFLAQKIAYFFGAKISSISIATEF